MTMLHAEADRQKRKMARIDDLPSATRAVVHDFGWQTVKTFMDCGVNDAKVMRRLIHIVLYEHSHGYRAGYQEPLR
jgi:hypothetical protein